MNRFEKFIEGIRNLVTKQDGAVPPLPWRAQRQIDGFYGNSQDVATVTEEILVRGRRGRRAIVGLVETVQGVTTVHRGGKPDEILIAAQSSGRRVSSPIRFGSGKNRGIQMEQGSTAVESSMFTPLNSSGAFQVGGMPERPKKRKG